MTTLLRTNQPDVFVINAPAFAAALTRSKGNASVNLRTRIANALVAAKVENADACFYLNFSRSPKSGRWYVRLVVHTFEREDALDYDAAAACNSVPSTNEYGF